MSQVSYSVDSLASDVDNEKSLLNLLGATGSRVTVESALGLNEHHQGNVLNYMRFARYQRGQRLRAVDACFQELKDSRLIEDTFTIDEVEDMLGGLLSVVRGEVESELINTAHTNILLLRQLFQQSEKWHLKLQADISELENRELLEKIKDFEDSEFSGTKRDQDFNSGSSSKLQPLNEGGGAALLNMEIERLKEENTKLQERLRSVESQAISAQKDRKQLQSELDRATSSLRQGAPRKPAETPEELEELRRQMSGLKSNMDKNQSSSASAMASMETDLTGTKHELLKIREMLEMAEKELEKKVSQTAPFKNLKQMLQKKNDQIKDLRRRLAKYETLD